MAATKPILVPLDGSKIAEYVIPAAGWYSRLTGFPLQFIHVLDGDTKPDQRAGAAESFQRYAADLAAAHNLGEVPCQVLAGSAADSVLSASTTAAAIALASRGKGGFRALITGSVADKIIRGSAVPVLVEPGTDIPTPPGAPRPILVGLDGSEEAEQGLKAAREMAARDGGKVILLRSFRVPPATGVEFAPYPTDLLTTLESAARDYLAQAAVSGEQTLLVQGDSANAILEAAEANDAGLIILTSTGKGLAKRIAIGSTTDRVIHGTNRAVLVIPSMG